MRSVRGAIGSTYRPTRHNGRGVIIPDPRTISADEAARLMVLPTEGYTPKSLAMVAAHMNLSTSYLYNLLDPHVEKAPLLIGHAAQLTNAARASGSTCYDILICAICAHCGFAAVELPNEALDDPTGILDALVSEIAEHADVVKAIAAALSPESDGGRTITPAEFRDIARQVLDAVVCLLRLERVTLRAATEAEVND